MQEIWLTLDLGNSALKGGLFAGERLLHAFNVPIKGVALDVALEAALEGYRPSRAAMASVVPALSGRVQEAVARITGRCPALIRPDWQLPVRLSYQTPHTLGADRLAAAAAAWVHYGQAGHRPVVVLLAGTALTLEVIDATGCFQGGLIAPGPELFRRALATGTAQLPEVPLDWPFSPIGRSTQEALQAGILYGFVESACGLLRRVTTALAAEPVVVLSGGWATLLEPHLGTKVHLEPYLVLEGVRLLLALNPERGR